MHYTKLKCIQSGVCQYDGDYIVKSGSKLLDSRPNSPIGRDQHAWRVARPKISDLQHRQLATPLDGLGLRVDTRLICPPVTVRPSRGRTVGRHPPPAIKPHSAGVAAEPPTQRLDHPPDRPAEGCSPAANPLYTAGEPTLSFRHHGSHLRSLPPVPMEVEGGCFVGCSVGIEDKPAGGRAYGLTERLRPPTSWSIQ